MRVLDSARETRAAQKTPGEIRRVRGDVHDLQRDVLPGVRVLRQIDRPHAASAQEAEDAVALVDERICGEILHLARLAETPGGYLIGQDHLSIGWASKSAAGGAEWVEQGGRMALSIPS